MSKSQRPLPLSSTPANSNDGRRKYKYLKITGHVSVKRVEEDDVPFESYCLVLVGPTGSGKSSFIEALNNYDPNPPLNIAKDQLDSVTQHTTIYHLEGVTSYRFPVYLIDTPGFADPKISEIKILDEMKIWRAKSDGTSNRFVRAYCRVIYMCPITDTRLAGRKRNYLLMTQNFWGEGNKYRARLVTTMWDSLIKGSESYKKAMDRFVGLNGHWKDLWDGGTGSSYVLRFRNTSHSAMDILDRVCHTVLARSAKEPSVPVEGYGGIRGEDADKTTSPLYRTLEERIEGLEQRLRSIKIELDDPQTLQYTELVGILKQEKEECTRNLERFVRDMAEYLEVEAEEVIKRLLVETLTFKPAFSSPPLSIVNKSLYQSLKLWVTSALHFQFKRRFTPKLN